MGRPEDELLGIPTPQHRASRLLRSTNGLPLPRIASLSARGCRPPISPAPDRVAPSTIEATARPKELIPVRSISFSSEMFLKRASSPPQRKRGSSSAPRSERGSIPRRLEIPNRSSAWAEGEPSASSLHQAGQTASIAALLSPSASRRFLSSLLSLLINAFLAPGSPQLAGGPDQASQSLGVG